jgi:hypothetical protein
VRVRRAAVLAAMLLMKLRLSMDHGPFGDHVSRYCESRLESVAWAGIGTIPSDARKTRERL